MEKLKSICEEEVREVLDKLIGFGDPVKATVFFFGLEEKGNSCIEAERFEIYKAKINNKSFFAITNKGLQKFKEKDAQTAETNKTYSRYISLFKTLEVKKDDNIKIKNSDIGSEKIKLFVGNIFPYPAITHAQAEKRITPTRKQALKEFFHDKEIINKNKKVFFFAKSEVDVVKELLCLNEIEEYKTKNNFEYYKFKYNNATCYILRHPIGLKDKDFENMLNEK